MRLLESKVTGMEINKVLGAFIVSWFVKAEGESTMLEEVQWQFTSSGACTQPETKWNSVKKPCLDWDQCVIKSVKVASQTNLFAWYFQLSEFHNIPTQESVSKPKMASISIALQAVETVFSYFKCNLFILLLAVLGLCCCTGFSLTPCGERRFLLQFDGFSLRWLLSLQSTVSRAWGLGSCSPGL